MVPGFSFLEPWAEISERLRRYITARVAILWERLRRYITARVAILWERLRRYITARVAILWERLRRYITARVAILGNGFTLHLPLRTTKALHYCLGLQSFALHALNDALLQSIPDTLRFQS